MCCRLWGSGNTALFLGSASCGETLPTWHRSQMRLQGGGRRAGERGQSTNERTRVGKKRGRRRKTRPGTSVGRHDGSSALPSTCIPGFGFGSGTTRRPGGHSPLSPLSFRCTHPVLAQTKPVSFAVMRGYQARVSQFVEMYTPYS